MLTYRTLQNRIRRFRFSLDTELRDPTVLSPTIDESTRFIFEKPLPDYVQSAFERIGLEIERLADGSTAIETDTYIL